VIRTALATLAIVAILGWFGPSLDDHSGEWDQAYALEDALNTAAARQRFEKAAQAICGPQAAWQELADGSIQCRTKHGRKTITAKVN